MTVDLDSLTYTAKIMLQPKFKIDHIESWFEEKDWTELGLLPTNVLPHLKRLIPIGSVLDARFFPQFDGKALDRVHLLFVTNHILYHAFLGHQKFVYSEYPIINVSVRIEFTYTKTGKLQNLYLFFDVGEQTESGAPRIHYLEAPAKARAHVLSLVSLMNKLKARSNWYGDSEN